jgi:alanyl-tRNA synthetase
VRSTAEIGPFVILTEGSVGSGARRIEAVTAGEAWAWLHGRARELDDVRTELEQARREAKKPKKEAQRVDVEPEIEVVGETNVIVMEVHGLGGQELLDLSDRFKQRSAPAAIVLGSRENGAASLVANFDQAVAEKVSAGDVVKAIAPLVGGKGGGRPTMARAGGKDPENLPEALDKARELIAAALS